MWKGLSFAEKDSTLDSEPATPIILGAVLNERYRIVFKLGQSKSSRIWLCYDKRDSTKRWKAIEIMKASESAKHRGDATVEVTKNQQENSRNNDHHISWPTDRFWIDGPNERYSCLITEPLGPPITTVRQEDPESIRSICLQVAKGLQYLHGHEICHGSLTPSSIHFRISSEMQNVSEAEMEKLLASSDTMTVRSDVDERLASDCSEWWLWPKELQHLVSEDDVCITGFGAAFYASNPPERIEISSVYAAPEALLNHQPACGVDTWSLACSVVEIRTGHRLFGRGSGELSEMISMYESYLGPLPQSYQACYLQRLRSCEQTQGDSKRDNSIAKKSAENDRNQTMSMETTPARMEKHLKWRKGSQISKPFREIIVQELVAGGTQLDDGDLDETHATARNRLSKAEALILGDLLSRIFRYEPAERLRIGEIIEHSWFGSQFRRSSEVTPGHSLMIHPENSSNNPFRVQENNEGLRSSELEQERRIIDEIEPPEFTENLGSTKPQLTQSSPSAHNSRFELINTNASGFIIGLAMATVFWTMLTVAKFQPAIGQLPWSPDAMLVERIARSAFGVEGVASR
ncbi:putative Protein kinase domain-containing protein [Seiridium unicorne]|uniref:Protein kinase domain-containing protein n=1 Tax=Seiridium unicorne TaxID=138068 RepID=A0ABR2UK53_9PEZI